VVVVAVVVLPGCDVCEVDVVEDSLILDVVLDVEVVFVVVDVVIVEEDGVFPP